VLGVGAGRGTIGQPTARPSRGCSLGPPMFHVKRPEFASMIRATGVRHNRYRCSPDALTAESLPPFQREFRLTEECFGGEISIQFTASISRGLHVPCETALTPHACRGLAKMLDDNARLWCCKGAIDANQCRLPTVWASGPRSCIRRRLITQSITEIADHSHAAYAASDTDEAAAGEKGELHRGLG
jgi:hypothetical protein